MSRPRAFLALLLAVTWCSAAWHCGLEAVGMLLDHEHFVAHQAAAHAPSTGTHHEHEDVVARDIAKDPLRLGLGGTLWFALAGLILGLTPALRPAASPSVALRQRRLTGPRWARTWQFVQRCAPPVAAPPALG